MAIKLTPAQARAMGVEAPRKPAGKRGGTTGQKVDNSLFLALCKSHGLPEPTPEHKFDPKRDWKFDWCWFDPPVFVDDQGRMFGQGVALEIEGGLYGRGKPCPTCKRRPPGAHSSIERLLGDLEKYNRAAQLGWRLVRCTPDQVAKGTIFPLLKEMLG